MAQTIGKYALFILLLGWGNCFSQQLPFEQFAEESGLTTNNVYDIAISPDGEIWVCTDNSIAQFNGLSFQSYFPQDSSITDICFDSQGYLWLNTSSGNIYQFSAGVFKPKFREASNQLSTSLINEHLVYNQQSWISSIINAHLFLCNSDSCKTVKTPKSAYFVKEVSTNQFIWGTGEDAQNNVLHISLLNNTLRIPFTKGSIPTKSSFIRLQNQNFLFAKDFELIQFSRTKLIKKVFFETNIQALFEDSKSGIWIGLLNGGLIHYPNGDLNSKNSIKYLGKKSVTSITEDFSGNIVVGSLNNGLFLFQPQTTEYAPPVLFSDTINQQQKSISSASNYSEEQPIDKRILNTSSSYFDSLPPKIYINSVQIMGVDTSVEQQYSLEHNQNFLQFSFIGFANHEASQIQYSYKLTGIDKDWRFTSNNNVQYTTLPPGEYRFIVNAMNKHGVWGETPAYIKVQIAPPYWKTWWFVLIVAGMLILIIALILYLWVNQVKQKEQAKSALDKQIAQIQLQALRSQMNPHFLFNTMSSIQHYITMNDTEPALKYLSKFARLMRKILDNSREDTISVHDEIEALELYLTLETLRFKSRLSYKITVDSSIQKNIDEIPPMLIQPYVENAIIHGIAHKKEGGKIEVSLTKKEGNLICKISDNGIGRQAAKTINESKTRKHKSSGMNITKKRLTILNQAAKISSKVAIKDLTNADGSAAGTAVTISIPLT